MTEYFSYYNELDVSHYMLLCSIIGTIEGFYCAKFIPTRKSRSIPAMIVVNFFTLYLCYRFADIIKNFDFGKRIGEDLFFAAHFFEPFIFFTGYLAITILCKSLACAAFTGFKFNFNKNIALNWKVILLTMLWFWLVREFVILKVYLR